MKSENVSIKPEYLPVLLRTVIKRSLLTPGSLRTGRPHKRMGLTPRELLGAFLVCSVGQYIDPDNVWTIGSDPEAQDGVICCVEGAKEGDAFALEQVYIPSFEQDALNDLIKNRILNKSSKGGEYSKDRHLVVFCDLKGELDLSVVSAFLGTQSSYMSYWIIARLEANRWDYLVATPKTSGDPCLAYKVHIADDFGSWQVEILGRLQTLIV